MRDSIDNIDAAIIHMLAERFQCTRAVGELKAQHGLPPGDPGREAEQVSRLRQLAAVSKLDPDFVEKFLALVIREVIRHHESIPQRARSAEMCDVPFFHAVAVREARQNWALSTRRAARGSSRQCS
jgi:chorismate mutase